MSGRTQSASRLCPPGLADSVRFRGFRPLNRRVNYGAEDMLQAEFPQLDGFQSPLLSQNDGFSPVQGEAIQIHHVRGNHWVTFSSIGQTVTILDSKSSGGELSSSLTHQLATIYRALIETQDEDGEEIAPLLHVHTPHVQQQQGQYI